MTKQTLLDYLFTVGCCRVFPKSSVEKLLPYRREIWHDFCALDCSPRTSVSFLPKYLSPGYSELDLDIAYFYFWDILNCDRLLR